MNYQQIIDHYYTEGKLRDILMVHSRMVADKAIKACKDTEQIPFVEAAAIPEVYMTAYLNLFHVGNAKQGETLLMNAGASGLASAVIPMAKAFGLRVITTVLGEEKVKELEKRYSTEGKEINREGRKQNQGTSKQANQGQRRSPQGKAR